MENTSFLNLIFTPAFLFSVLRVMTPILFAALASTIAARADILNIAIEGTMLIAALTGAIVSAYTQSAWIGFFGAIAISIFISLMLLYFNLELNSNLSLTGIAINLLAGGGTIFVMYILTGDKTFLSNMSSKVMPSIQIPLIHNIPILGEIISGHNILTYFSLIAVVVMHVLMYKIPLGLRIRAVGESADAVGSVGVSIKKTKYIAIAICGALCGMGGAYMSMGYLPMFAKNMVAGRGFIAIAAANVGGLTPVGSLISSLFFGVTDALSNALQMLKVPTEFVQMIPYVIAIFSIAFFSKKRLQTKKL